MKIELDYGTNRIILDLNDVDASFDDSILEEDRFERFQVINKEVFDLKMPFRGKNK